MSVCVFAAQSVLAVCVREREDLTVKKLLNAWWRKTRGENEFVFIYFEPERELSHVSLPPLLRYGKPTTHTHLLYTCTFARVGHGQIKYLHLYLFIIKIPQTAINYRSFTGNQLSFCCEHTSNQKHNHHTYTKALNHKLFSLQTPRAQTTWNFFKLNQVIK